MEFSGRALVVAVVVVGLLVVATGTAQADLISADLITAGDGLLTRDTDTGLEWLDLTATRNLSVTDILNGNGGWIAMGFEYATRSQISTLFSHSATGVSLDTGYSLGANATGAAKLLTLMGQTATFYNSTNPWGWGWAADGPPSGLYYAPYYQVQGSDSAGLFNTTFTDDGERNTEAGSWLVRTTATSAVPEPGTLGLLGLGLLGVALQRRRKLSAS